MYNNLNLNKKFLDFRNIQFIIKVMFVMDHDICCCLFIIVIECFVLIKLSGYSIKFHWIYY